MGTEVLRLTPQADLPIEFDDPVRTVFEFWKALMGHERGQLGPKRRASISRALSIGYTVDDLRLAIVGCKVDAWSQGQNDRHTRYDDVELICRDETKIDRFMQIGEERIRAQIAKERGAIEAAKPENLAVPMPPEIRARLDAIFKNSRHKKPSA